MRDRLVALIVDEGKWPTFSMGVALLAMLWFLGQTRGGDGRRRTQGAMSLFFSTTVGTMAFGHLLAVSTKLVVGSLEGSTLAFFAIGVALAVPSWWLLAHTLRVAAAESPGRRSLALHLWPVATLLALGLHNLPLALPGLLSCAYQLHSRRALGLALVGAAVLVNGGLFVGSLVFLASGKSFEDFSGMR